MVGLWQNAGPLRRGDAFRDMMTSEFLWSSSEVTKVRRNLFNQEVVSPSKRAKLPRSRSVSAVEGLKRKRSDESEGKKNSSLLQSKGKRMQIISKFHQNDRVECV